MQKFSSIPYIFPKDQSLSFTSFVTFAMLTVVHMVWPYQSAALTDRSECWVYFVFVPLLSVWQACIDLICTASYSWSHWWLSGGHDQRRCKGRTFPCGSTCTWRGFVLCTDTVAIFEVWLEYIALYLKKQAANPVLLVCGQAVYLFHRDWLVCDILKKILLIDQEEAVNNCLPIFWMEGDNNLPNFFPFRSKEKRRQNSNDFTAKSILRYTRCCVVIAWVLHLFGIGREAPIAAWEYCGHQGCKQLQACVILVLIGKDRDGFNVSGH